MDTLSEPQFVQPRRSPLLRKQKETVNGHEVVRRSQYLDDSDPDSSEVSLSAASSRSFQSQNSRNVAIDNRTGEDIAIIQRQTRTNSKSGWKAKQKWTTDAGTKLVGTADPILWAPVSTTDTDDKGWIYTNGVSRVPQLFEDQHSKNCDKLHTVRYRRWHMLTLIERRDDLDPVPLTTEHETKYLLLSVLRGYDLSKISGARTLYRMSKKHEPLWTEFFEDQAPIQPDSTSDAQKQINSIINRACVVAVHAKGVYGIPQEKMYLNGASGYLRMKVKQNLTNSQTEAPKKRPEKWESKNLQSCLRMTGLEEDDILLHNWTGAMHRPAFYIAIDRRLKAIIVAIRGTVSTGDMFTDASAKPSVFKNGHMHTGMKLGAEWVIVQSLKVIAAAILTHPTYEILITGHSLGAGCTAAATILLREDFDTIYDQYAPDDIKHDEGVKEKVRQKMTNVHGYAFATPCITTKRLAKLSTDYCYTFVYKKDIIPRTGLPQVEYLLTEMQEDKTVPNPNDFYARFSSEERMIPTGRIFQIWKPGNGVNKDLDLSRHGAMLVGEVEPMWFSRLLFSKNIVWHHILDNYISGLMEHNIHYVESDLCSKDDRDTWTTFMPYLQPSLSWKKANKKAVLKGRRASLKLDLNVEGPIQSPETTNSPARKFRFKKLTPLASAKASKEKTIDEY